VKKKVSDKMYLGEILDKNPGRMGTVPSPINGGKVKKQSARSEAARKIMGYAGGER
jgi:hypothetical protein